MTGGTVAVDVGGTSVKALAVDESGAIVSRARVATSADGAQSLAQLGSVIDDLAAALRARVPLARIGVAVPGLVDTGAGVVQLATNLGWRDLALRDHLERRFAAPVRVDNDARVGALAERAWARPEDQDLAFVPIGTGVSASFTASGRAVEGSTGSAGEFGHLRAVEGGERCTCGNRGCVEVYASAANILARYRARGGTARSVPEVIARRDDDRVAAAVWDDAIAALGAGLVALITLLDPPRIVIGGGLSLAGEVLLEPVRARVERDFAWRPVPAIVASALGSHSSLVGAALPVAPEQAATAQSVARSLATQLTGTTAAVTL